MSPVRAAVVVARREFSERVRTRAFQISMVVTLLIVGAVAVLAGVLGGDGATDYTVGAQGAEASAIAGAARGAAPGFKPRSSAAGRTWSASSSACAGRESHAGGSTGPGTSRWPARTACRGACATSAMRRSAGSATSAWTTCA